jgi:2-polyprenyl-6-methoxyphenol hydroxylase-like FAD-dependent oxidoreductase
MDDIETPILIVGGGPVGLALASELGWRGVNCTLIERGDGDINIPKMNEVNMRSMEICRRWGIADKVIKNPFPADMPFDVSFVTSLFGHELGRIPRPARKDQKPNEFSPHMLQVCSQFWFDPILRDFAGSFDCVGLRYRQKLETFSQDDDGVTATIVDQETAEETTLRAQYLVSCEGANSSIREALGIKMQGTDEIERAMNAFFKAPNLMAETALAPATFFFHVDPGGLWANVRQIDPANDLWRIGVRNFTGDGVPDERELNQFLLRALGRNYDVTWVDAHVWSRRAVVASAYSEGNVFLAGDAVHQLSPSGALGMNTGIGDAVDLGWKLAATVKGWAGPGLLQSYDLERRPIGTRNVEKATGFNAEQSSISGFDGMEDNTREAIAKRAELGKKIVRTAGNTFRTVGLQIGYRYEKSPICVPEDVAAPEDSAAIYQPTTYPGCRAPHMWLEEGVSILDKFAEDFTLLRFDQNLDVSAFERAAAAQSVPVAVINIKNKAAAKLYQQPLVLVRPDGHVAWRGEEIPSNPELIIDTVRGGV